jgi:hemin uptake protein HemP
MNPEESHDESRPDDSHDASSLDAIAQRTLSITPKYRYADLSRSSSEVLIEHEGQIYRLRKTRNGKLILIK